MPERAQAFARDIHFGEFSRLTRVRSAEEPPPSDGACADCGYRVLWTAEGRVTCSRGCVDNPEVPAARNQAFAAAFAASTGLFDVSEALTGPAQIALSPYVLGPNGYIDPDAVAWPLARAAASVQLLAPE